MGQNHSKPVPGYHAPPLGHTVQTSAAQAPQSAPQQQQQQVATPPTDDDTEQEQEEAPAQDALEAEQAGGNVESHGSGDTGPLNYESDLEFPFGKSVIAETSYIARHRVRHETAGDQTVKRAGKEQNQEQGLAARIREDGIGATVQQTSWRKPRGTGGASDRPRAGFTGTKAPWRFSTCEGRAEREILEFLRQGRFDDYTTWHAPTKSNNRSTHQASIVPVLEDPNFGAVRDSSASNKRPIDETQELRRSKRLKQDTSSETLQPVLKAPTSKVMQPELKAPKDWTIVKKCTCKPALGRTQPMPAYNLYVMDQFSEERSKNSKVNSKIIQGKIGRAWTAASPKVRQQYEDRAEQMKKDFLDEHPGYKFDHFAKKKYQFGDDDCTCGAIQENTAANRLEEADADGSDEEHAEE